MTPKRLSQVFSHFVPPLPTRAKSSNGIKAETSRNEDSKLVENSKVKELPTFDELPMFKNMPGCAWSVWGETDQLGTVNMLTEEVVAKAAKEEIKYGFQSFPTFVTSTKVVDFFFGLVLM
jgi:hypothetical protein